MLHSGGVLISTTVWTGPAVFFFFYPTNFIHIDRPVLFGCIFYQIVIACNNYSGIILGMDSANENRRYYGTHSLTGRAHTRNEWSLLYDAPMYKFLLEMFNNQILDTFTWAIVAKASVINMDRVSAQKSLQNHFGQQWANVMSVYH